VTPANNPGVENNSSRWEFFDTGILEGRILTGIHFYVTNAHTPGGRHFFKYLLACRPQDGQTDLKTLT